MTTIRTHGGMTKRKVTLATVIGTLAFKGEIGEITHKPATGGRPEMWRAKVHGVEIWFKEVDPASFTNGKIVGRLEVKSNEVTKVRRDSEEEYLYVNVLPLPDGATPTATVTIMRPPKRQGRRVLPDDFNPASDYYVERYNQPSSLVRVVDVLQAVSGVRFASFTWDWKENPPATEMSRVAATLSNNGPAVVVEIDTEADFAYTIIMDATGSEEIAQKIWDELRGEGNEELFFAKGKISVWTPAAPAA